MENEGKPAAAAAIGDRGKMVEVPYEELADIERTLEKIIVQMKDICSSDIMSSLLFEGDDTNSESKVDSGSCRPELLKALAATQDDVRIHSEFVLLKVRNIIPRQLKGSDDEMSGNTNLKRPLSQPHVPPTPPTSDWSVLPQGDLSNGGNGPAFGVASPTPGPLKYFRTSDNTKAAYQKPSIFTPIPKYGQLVLEPPNTVPNPKHGQLMAEAPDTVPASGEAASAPMGMISKPLLSNSKRKPTGRSRRDKCRTRDKPAELPEPVMQKLEPGDTNKIPDDGYLWRKYGNKPIKTASYKRGYYKCRLFKEVKCAATKIVQQTNNDPSTFSVIYKGEHTCKQASGPLASTRLQLGNHPDSNGSLADQVNEHRDLDLDLDDPKSPGDAEDEDPLDGLDWQRDDVSCDSAGEEDLFPASEQGEEAVESVRRPAAAVEKTLGAPTSPLIDFDMPAITGMSTEEMISAAPQASPWNETLRSPSAGDFKPKYSPMETCPPEGGKDTVAQGEHSLDDETNQLLKMMMMNDGGHTDGGLYDHGTISDINFWSSDFLSTELLQF